MIGGPGDQDHARRRPIALHRDSDRQNALLPKPRGHPLGHVLVYVLDDHDRGAKILRQRTQHRRQRRRASGGCADSDQGVAVRLKTLRLRRISAHASASPIRSTTA